MILIRKDQNGIRLAVSVICALVSLGYGGQIRSEDTSSSPEALTLKGHSGPVFSVAFSPDGKRIVSGSDDKTLKVWDAKTGRETLTLRGHSNALTSVAFSPDGKRIVSGSHGGTLKVWNTETHQ